MHAQAEHSGALCMPVDGGVECMLEVSTVMRCARWCGRAQGCGMHAHGECSGAWGLLVHRGKQCMHTVRILVLGACLCGWALTCGWELGITSGVSDVGHLILKTCRCYQENLQWMIVG